MRRELFVFLLTVFFFLPVNSYADNSADAPLTLLQPSQQGGQPAQVQPLYNDNGQLYDIQGPVLVSELPPYLLIFGALGLLLLAAVILYWFLRKKGAQPIVVISPWENALSELAEARNLLTPEKGLLYMARVSQILRSYIELRFTIKSTRQTTREFLQGLAQVDDNSPLQIYRAELKGCLEQADMAKFAHHQPTLDNLQQMEVAITTFIKRTEPTEPQPSTPAKSTKQIKRGRK